MPVSATSRPGIDSASGALAVCTPLVDTASACAGVMVAAAAVFWLDLFSIACSTSRLITRPPGPVPLMLSIAMPLSSAMRRATGLTRMRGPSSSPRLGKPSMP